MVDERDALPQMRMSMQNLIRLSQHEQSVDSYIEMDIIVGLPYVNPSLQR